MLVESWVRPKRPRFFPLTLTLTMRAGPVRLVSIHNFQSARLNLKFDNILLSYLNDSALKIGSNNWVAAPRLSAGARPVVANDPHFEATILPGPLYPCGLITPELRAVGVTIPGIGGMIIGRTDHISYGATNAYSDAQDLFIETVDPDNPEITSKAVPPYRLR